MGAIYVAALMLGLGALGLRPLLPGSDADAPSEPRAAGGGSGMNELSGDVNEATPLLSLRCFAVAFAGFGLVGAGLHFLSLAGALATATLALFVGVSLGVLVTYAFRAQKKA